MARIHARVRGRAGSKKPSVKTLPKWIRYKKNEIEKLVINLAKEGNKSSQIGLILRDQFGIPSVRNITGRTIGVIMKDNSLYPKFPEDLLNLLKRAVVLRNHLEKNKKDYTSKRNLELLESKVRRLGKYYSRRKIIDPNWTYDPAVVKLLVQQK